MTRISRTVFLMVISLSMKTLIRGDTEVFCIFMERCTLPCSFPPGTDVVIHWIQVSAGYLLVCSFYHNKDQLGHQDQRFTNRTSLFKDQLSTGNASLQLTGVKVQDEDRYKCHTSTVSGNKDSFINLRVDAPVQQVDLQQVGNRIFCSSEDIYPEPELTWSIRPPSNIPFKNTTTIQQTEQLLHSVHSSLIFPPYDTDLVFSCTISTRRNKKRSTLKQLSSFSSSSRQTTIPCNESNTSLEGLIWRFNHSQIILSQTGADANYTISEEWRQHVKNVSESGSLTLQNLTPDKEGIYTCELRNSEETYVRSTSLRISNNKGSNIRSRIFAIIPVIAAAALVIAALSTGLHRKNCKKPRNSETLMFTNRQEAQVKT